MMRGYDYVGMVLTGLMVFGRNLRFARLSFGRQPSGLLMKISGLGQFYPAAGIKCDYLGTANLLTNLFS